MVFCLAASVCNYMCTWYLYMARGLKAIMHARCRPATHTGGASARVGTVPAGKGEGAHTICHSAQKSTFAALGHQLTGGLELDTQIELPACMPKLGRSEPLTQPSPTH